MLGYLYNSSMIPLLVLAFLFIPGIPLALIAHRRSLSELAWIGLAGAWGILWMASATMLAALLHVPLSQFSLGVLAASPLVALLSIPVLRTRMRSAMTLVRFGKLRIILLALITAILVVPFTRTHAELPTGDIQKAIYWATQIQESGRLPDYQSATSLNRDPVDFFTPALHTLTAAVGTTSGDLLRGSAWMSFIASMLLACMAVAWIDLLPHRRGASAFVFLFAALNLRILRYTLYSGYHYQNLIGELLLITGLWIACEALSRRDRVWRGLIRALPFFLILPLVHQFTAFLLVVSAPLLFAIVLRIQWPTIQKWQRTATQRARRMLSAVLLVLAVTILAVATHPLIREKLGHLFTATPHLTGFVIPLWEYPALFGPSLTLWGIAGLFILGALFRKTEQRTSILLLGVWTMSLLILGQGPYFGIDIPSARALFYAAIPLSVFAGIFVTEALHRTLPSLPARTIFLPFLSLLVLTPLGQTALGQLKSVTHRTRVNTTLTAETLELMSTPSQPPSSNRVLVDDWNRRRLTWLLLSNAHMLTRVGGDLRVIADEAQQSSLRAELYGRHLDFEKIFMLGNSPVILPLLERHGITQIAAATGISDDLFDANPLLVEQKRTADGTLYGLNERKGSASDDSESQFLLTPTTLANDVGDREDILSHSALSLVATRVGDPEKASGRTTRTIDADQFDLRLNVGTYLRPLWDADGNSVIDHPLRLLVRTYPSTSTVTVSSNTDALGSFRITPGVTEATLLIPAGTLTIDDHGFATITLASQDQPLTLDLVAVGIVPINR